MGKKYSVNLVSSFVVMMVLSLLGGLFVVVNQQFQVPIKASMFGSGSGSIANVLVTLLTFSCYLAYPISQGISARWLDKYGYRWTTIVSMLALIAGLLLYEVAALMHIYYPMSIDIYGSQVSFGFFIFLVGSFIVGAATAVMQIILNLYLTVEPFKTSDALQRQMYSGTLDSVGGAIAPIMVGALLFSGVPLHEATVKQYLVPLLGVILLMVGVTMWFARVRMPQILSIQSGAIMPLSKSVWSFKHFKLGVWAMFFYVGAEIAVGANINMYAVERGGNYAASAAHMAALYWGAILAGRVLFSFVKAIAPQKQLVWGAISGMIFLVPAMIFNNPWFLVLTGLSHSVMYPAIFTLAISGLERYTIKGSGVLMIGVIGGGVLPLLQGVMCDMMGGQWRYTWVIVVVSELFVLLYGIKGWKIKYR